MSEIFGPTVQGEGHRTGHRCGFVRFARCDLQCSYCDTPYTWDWQGKNGTKFDPAVEISTMSVDDVYAELSTMHVPGVVITGGEPMVQRAGLRLLSTRLLEAGMWVQIETNGRHSPANLDDRIEIVASPKLSNSGHQQSETIRPDALRSINDRGGHLKFVVSDRAQVVEVDDIVEVTDFDTRRVWLMPEARTAAELNDRLPTVTEMAIDRGFNVSSRLHIGAWGDVRGK